LRYFFFQAEDGIRDFHVTGVQTCALPIFLPFGEASASQVRTPGLSIFVINAPKDLRLFVQFRNSALPEPLEMQRASRYWETYYKIGRASCRERVSTAVGERP